MASTNYTDKQNLGWFMIVAVTRSKYIQLRTIVSWFRLVTRPYIIYSKPI